MWLVGNQIPWSLMQFGNNCTSNWQNCIRIHRIPNTAFLRIGIISISILLSHLGPCAWVSQCESLMCVPMWWEVASIPADQSWATVPKKARRLHLLHKACPSRCYGGKKGFLQNLLSWWKQWPLWCFYINMWPSPGKGCVPRKIYICGRRLISSEVKVGRMLDKHT